MKRKGKIMNEVNTKDIYVGIVKHIRVLGPEEKERDKNGKAITPIASAGSKSVVDLNVRKIVFVKCGDRGYELPSGLSKESKYNYKTMNLIVDSVKDGKLAVKNNTLVIDTPRPVGDLLVFAGFPNVVSGSEIRKVKKFLLSSDKTINIRKHSLKLTPRGFLNMDKVNEANEEASSYYWFKDEKAPIKPQEKEKVYAKHFK